MREEYPPAYIIEEINKKQQELEQERPRLYIDLQLPELEEYQEPDDISLIIIENV